jgi:hypothetical protein
VGAGRLPAGGGGGVAACASSPWGRLRRSQPTTREKTLHTSTSLAAPARSGSARPARRRRAAPTVTRDSGIRLPPAFRTAATAHGRVSLTPPEQTAPRDAPPNPARAFARPPAHRSCAPSARSSSAIRRRCSAATERSCPPRSGRRRPRSSDRANAAAASRRCCARGRLRDRSVTTERGQHQLHLLLGRELRVLALVAQRRAPVSLSGPSFGARRTRSPPRPSGSAPTASAPRTLSTRYQGAGHDTKQRHGRSNPAKSAVARKIFIAAWQSSPAASRSSPAPPHPPSPPRRERHRSCPGKLLHSSRPPRPTNDLRSRDSCNTTTCARLLAAPGGAAPRGAAPSPHRRGRP